MSTFDDKLFEVVKGVEEVREMVGEKPLTETFATKEHTHRVSDIEIYSEDVITEYSEQGLMHNLDFFLTTEKSGSGYILKLKTVPSGDWSIKFDYNIKTNAFENNYHSEYSIVISKSTSTNINKEELGFSIVGGTECAEGIKITLPMGCYFEMNVEEITGIETSYSVDLPAKRYAIVGSPLNDRFIYGQAVNDYIGKKVIPLITALEEKITALDTRIKALESPGG